MILAFCLRADDYSPVVGVISTLHRRESCSVNLAQMYYISPRHNRTVRASKVRSASLRYFQRTEPWDGLLAEHALRQSRGADHRYPFTVGLPAIRSSASRLRYLICL